MSKDPRKDELKKAWREQERQKLLVSIPMPHQDLRDLFDLLDDAGGVDCDHTLRVSIRFLQGRGLDMDRIVPWLREHGGYCDCEVLANVEGKFSEILGR